MMHGVSFQEEGQNVEQEEGKVGPWTGQDKEDGSNGTYHEEPEPFTIVVRSTTGRSKKGRAQKKVLRVSLEGR